MRAAFETLISSRVLDRSRDLVCVLPTPPIISSQSLGPVQSRWTLSGPGSLVCDPPRLIKPTQKSEEVKRGFFTEKVERHVEEVKGHKFKKKTYRFKHCDIQTSKFTAISTSLIDSTCVCSRGLGSGRQKVQALFLLLLFLFGSKRFSSSPEPPLIKVLVKSVIVRLKVATKKVAAATLEMSRLQLR
ncbi:uncharacterized protein V6R79_025745 [Siganus canaliculatus]